MKALGSNPRQIFFLLKLYINITWFMNKKHKKKLENLINNNILLIDSLNNNGTKSLDTRFYDKKRKFVSIDIHYPKESLDQIDDDLEHLEDNIKLEKIDSKDVEIYKCMDPIKNETKICIELDCGQYEFKNKIKK